MKSLGIVRQLDGAGRIVLPKELRKTLDLKDNVDSLEIFIDHDKIILRKYAPSCIFCESMDDVVDFKGKNVCTECIKKLSDAID